MNEIGISIGWNCHSARYGVDVGLRTTKENGYKTCPFDLMVTTYEGVVQCIDEDFKYLCDETYLCIGPPRIVTDSEKSVLYNVRYGFGFIHETPGASSLLGEDWAEGPTHFVDNNYYHLKERYARRVANFRHYLSDSNAFITFILTTWNKTQDDVIDLKRVLEKHYPNLNYRIELINDPKGEDYFKDHMRHMTEATHDIAAYHPQE
jgi:hypothetical protein